MLSCSSAPPSTANYLLELAIVSIQLMFTQTVWCLLETLNVYHFFKGRKSENKRWNKANSLRSLRAGDIVHKSTSGRAFVPEVMRKEARTWTCIRQGVWNLPEGDKATWWTLSSKRCQVSPVSGTVLQNRPPLKSRHHTCLKHRTPEVGPSLCCYTFILLGDLQQITDSCKVFVDGVFTLGAFTSGFHRGEGQFQDSHVMTHSLNCPKSCATNFWVQCLGQSKRSWQEPQVSCLLHIFRLWIKLVENRLTQWDYTTKWLQEHPCQVRTGSPEVSMGNNQSKILKDLRYRLPKANQPDMVVVEKQRK